MTIKFLESGTAASQDFSWYQFTANVTSDATTVHTGPRSIKCNTGTVPSAAEIDTPDNTCQDTGTRTSFWINVAILPATSCELVRFSQTGAGATCLGFGMNSSGKLISTFGPGIGSTTLTTGTWHRISAAYTLTSTTVNTLKVWLDGVLQFTDTNVTLTTVTTSCMSFGYLDSTNSGTNRVAYYSDIYLDDSSALTDPGDVRVTVKLPAAAGSSNNFDTLGGSGTNRWDRVSERPFNTANYIAQAATTQANELFTVQTASAGDVDCTGGTILGLCGYVWSAAGTGTLSTGTAGPGLTLAGTTTNLTLTTTAKLFTVYSTTSIYPSTNQAIGMRSNTNTADTFFYDGGILIAYIPGVAPSLFPPFPPASWTGLRM